MARSQKAKPFFMSDFNSAEFAWKDIEISWMGRVIARVMEIEYTTDVEKKHIYGRGKKPLGVQTGNEKSAGTTTIGQSEYNAMLEKIQQTQPGAKITDISLDINIAYLSETQVLKDRVVGASFMQSKKGMKQGDTDMEIKLPFIAMDVQENI